MNTIKRIIDAWLGLGVAIWFQILVMTIIGWLIGREINQMNTRIKALETIQTK